MEFSPTLRIPISHCFVALALTFHITAIGNSQPSKKFPTIVELVEF